MALEGAKEFADRLKANGEYRAFRKHRKDLEAEGVSAADAWNRAAEKFGRIGYVRPIHALSPPTGGPGIAVRYKERAPTLTSRKSDFEGLPEDVPAPAVDMRRDMLWVYDNREVEDVTAKDAPSSAAWGLLQWAKKNGDIFYSRIITMVKERADVDEDRYLDDGRTQLTLIDRLLKDQES